MALTALFTDNRNDGSVTVTITGGDGTSVNLIYVQQVSNSISNPIPKWTLVGSITGNGTLNIVLNPAYYWGYCSGTTAGNPVVSNLYYFAATSSSSAVATRLQAAIVSSLSSIALPDSPNANMYSMMVPNWKTVQYPCIFVTFENEQEEMKGGLSGVDNIGYPFKIQIVDRSSEDYIANTYKYQYWRQSLMRLFRNQRFATIPENQINIVQPQKIVSVENEIGYQLLAIGIRLVCYCREPRGGINIGPFPPSPSGTIALEFNQPANSQYLGVVLI
jgi:hypothetical protein